MLIWRSPWIWPYGGLTLLLSLVLCPAWTSVDRLIIGGDATLAHFPYFVLWRDVIASGQLPFWNPYTFSGIPASADIELPPQESALAETQRRLRLWMLARGAGESQADEALVAVAEAVHGALAAAEGTPLGARLLVVHEAGGFAVSADLS